jgi:hypothetical protein
MLHVMRPELWQKKNQMQTQPPTLALPPPLFSSDPPPSQLIPHVAHHQISLCSSLPPLPFTLVPRVDLNTLPTPTIGAPPRPTSGDLVLPPFPSQPPDPERREPLLHSRAPTWELPCVAAQCR